MCQAGVGMRSDPCPTGEAQDWLVKGREPGQTQASAHLCYEASCNYNNNHSHVKYEQALL